MVCKAGLSISASLDILSGYRSIFRKMRTFVIPNNVAMFFAAVKTRVSANNLVECIFAKLLLSTEKNQNLGNIYALLKAWLCQRFDEIIVFYNLNIAYLVRLWFLTLCTIVQWANVNFRALLSKYCKRTTAYVRIYSRNVFLWSFKKTK